MAVGETSQGGLEGALASDELVVSAVVAAAVHSAFSSVAPLVEPPSEQISVV